MMDLPDGIPSDCEDEAMWLVTTNPESDFNPGMLEGWENVADPPEDLDQTSATVKLLHAAAAAGANPVQKEKVIEFAKEHSGFSKGTLRDTYSEAEADNATDVLEFRDVEKVYHEDPEKDPTWVIEMGYEGDTATFRGGSDRLTNPSAIKNFCLSHFDDPVRVGKAPEWSEAVGRMLDEADITERMEEPETREHRVFEQAMECISKSKVTTKRSVFQGRRNETVYYDEDDDSVYVSLAFLQDQAAKTVEGISWAAVRNIMTNRDILKNGTTDTVQEWDDGTRVWNFSPAEVVERTGMDPAVFGLEADGNE